MKIPKKHVTWVTIHHNNTKYYITSPEVDRSTYSLYKMVGDNNEVMLLGTSANPLKLEKKVFEDK